MRCIGPPDWCSLIIDRFGKKFPDDKMVAILLNADGDFQDRVKELELEVSKGSDIVVSSLTSKKELSTNLKVRALLEKCTFVYTRTDSIIDHLHGRTGSVL